MASKFLPPLLVPIPKGHDCHYMTVEQQLRLQLNVNRAYNLLFEDFEEDKPRWADLSKMKSTWNRIFARRRSVKKKINKDVYAILSKIRGRPGSNYRYAIVNSSGDVINTYKTLNSARKDINKSSLRVKRHGRWVWRDLDYGSSIIPLRDSWNAIEDAQDALPIQNKKCSECPNKTSRQGTCHCQFWASLRGDSVQKHRWMTPHEVKMFEHKRRKTDKLNESQSKRLHAILKRS